ncbi:MAG: YybH family protein [Gemmatimonadaceae bacterium]
MTKLRLLSIALVVAGCASGMRSASSSAVMPASDVAAIRAVFDTTAYGWNHGDLSAYLYAYAPSATTMGRTGLVRGPSAIGDQMRAYYWKTGSPAQSLAYDHLEVRPLGRNHALATGQYVLTGGAQPEHTGWFSTIWERTPAGWRMIHDHS